MPEISGPYMQTLDANVRLDFNTYLEGAAPTYQEFAMVVGSTSRENFFPRLDEIPGLREWVGPRVLHDLSMSAFSIVNKTFENTIGISRDDIEDDQFGVFQIGVRALGRNAGTLPDKLCYGLLNTGTTQKSYDGQNFFDTDHVNYDPDGTVISYSNNEGPAQGETAGPAWYAVDTTQILQPVIFQNRRPFVITSKTKLDDDNVFDQNKFIWGTDGRCNAGFGMWQLAYRSTRPLTPTSYGAARAAMGTLRRPDGEPYSITPNKIIVPKSLEGVALKLQNAKEMAIRQPDGTTVFDANEWAGTFKPVVSAYL